MREIRAGTSGFSYKPWRGPFYPEDLPQKRWLSFYAEQLPAVELNNTFYRMPKASVVAGWAEQVPETFRFAIKASRRITHFKRLRDVGEETLYLLTTTAELGPRLGALLFQLPPNLRLDLDRLDAFLDLLPPGTPAVFEFRHESWQDDAVLARLDARGAGWVVNDAEDAPEPALRTSGTRAYLRLRRPSYDEAALERWAGRVAELATPEAFVFFKHEDEGAAPKMAKGFLGAVARRDVRATPHLARPARPAREA